MMANPNPSPETRFKPGQTLNPYGKTSEQRLAEIANAERATRIRTKLLEKLESSIEDASDGQVLAKIQADNLKLLKDSEDRGLGTPKQSVALTGPGGGPIQTISTEMTAQEAAEAYAATLNADKG